jgi:hypothetical protein
MWIFSFTIWSLPCFPRGSFPSRRKVLGALEDENGPATAVFIVDFESRPEFDQPWPKAVYLALSYLARLVLCCILPNLKLCDRMTSQIDYPRICPLEFGSDITNYNRFAIAKIEYRDSAIFSGPATFRG